MNRQGRDNRRSPSPILIGLIVQLLSQLERSPYKPPITIALLFINIFVHVSPYPNFLGYDLTSISQNCIYPSKIVNGLMHNNSLQLNRLVLSSIIHVDDMHLYYNMLSLCWKGIQLESHLGSAAYLKLIVFSLIVSHTLLVVVSYLLDSMGVDSALSGYNSCAVGFSAVLFSLKYVWNHHASSAAGGGLGATGQVMGMFSVPLRYVAWLELVLISLLSPNVSFLGHLSGILAGLLYVHGPSLLSGGLVPRAIREAVASLFSLGNGIDGVRTTPRRGDEGSTRYTYASGTAGSSSASMADNLRGRTNARQSTNNANSSNMASTSRPVFDAAEVELEESPPTKDADSAVHRAEEARQQRLRRFGR